MKYKKGDYIETREPLGGGRNGRAVITEVDIYEGDFRYTIKYLDGWDPYGHTRYGHTKFNRISDFCILGKFEHLSPSRNLKTFKL
jgi:hypothetical protein